MKAIIQENYDGIHGLVIRDIPDPAKGPLSAIIETKYTPVLPYDILTEERKLKGMRPTKLPMVIGYGFGGRVKEVGGLRNSRLIGQKVIGVNFSGSNSEWINATIPPLLFKVPDQVSIADATTIIGGADAALYASNQIKVTAQDTVLITGAAGGVGTYLIQLLVNEGAVVIAVGHSSNHQFLTDIGAKYVINYDEPFAPQLMRVPIVDKVIDTVGSKTLLDGLSDYYEGLTIFSLSLTDYRPMKLNQSFSFGNGGIGLSGYHQLLLELASGRLKAYVHSQFDFNEVIEAQQMLKDTHVQGRVLLNY
ncbi:quinone oxidoreductase family protein [Lentilactobacillus kisonensis]|uniref:GroES-like protein n=1 Tax=Lentilactobacillus kisonensis F0435 TaxID=797516 RepID=H1LD07_9LACO|nr:zinc-binding dehydrogenase [Lentilactobacillus kisonensis]EHO53615.1 GroES-like protein [Lentilactobacillus kisonensis F0435]